MTKACLASHYYYSAVSVYVAVVSYAHIVSYVYMVNCLGHGASILSLYIQRLIQRRLSLKLVSSNVNVSRKYMGRTVEIEHLCIGEPSQVFSEELRISYLCHQTEIKLSHMCL